MGKAVLVPKSRAEAEIGGYGDSGLACWEQGGTAQGVFLDNDKKSARFGSVCLTLKIGHEQN